MNTDQENPISNTKNSSAQAASVGQTLREAREQQGLSVNDVANRIKFAPKQIEWLEADEFAHLPEAAFVRGFVRSYARLLELDPTHLLSVLPSTHAQPASNKEMKSVEVVMPSSTGNRRYNVMLLVAGLVIALSVAIYERMHSKAPGKSEIVGKTRVEELQLPGLSADSASAPASDQEPVVEEQTPPQQAERIAPAVATPVVETPKSVRAAPVAGPVPPESHKTVRTTPVVPAQETRPPRTVAATTVPASETYASPAGVATEHSLRFELDEDAWLEVKDGNDKVLLSKMHSAGSLVRVTGASPLLVIIGNARAVRLFDNGKNIKLDRYTTAEVARVKLK